MKEIFDNDNNSKILVILDWLQDMLVLKDQFKKDEYVKSKSLTIGTYCQLVRNQRERENHLNCNIIIGSIGSMQNGKDIRGLRAIFPFTQFSSEIVARQLLGRLRPIEGKEVIYYDIADYSVPDIMKQRMVRRKVFEQRSKNSIKEYVIKDMGDIGAAFEKSEPGYFRNVMIR
jgi:hypothetical protein